MTTDATKYAKLYSHVRSARFDAVSSSAQDCYYRLLRLARAGVGHIPLRGRDPRAAFVAALELRDAEHDTYRARLTELVDADLVAVSNLGIDVLDYAANQGLRKSRSEIQSDYRERRRARMLADIDALGAPVTDVTVTGNASNAGNGVTVAGNTLPSVTSGNDVTAVTAAPDPSPSQEQEHQSLSLSDPLIVSGENKNSSHTREAVATDATETPVDAAAAMVVANAVLAATDAPPVGQNDTVEDYLQALIDGSDQLVRGRLNTEGMLVLLRVMRGRQMSVDMAKRFGKWLSVGPCTSRGGEWVRKHRGTVHGIRVGQLVSREGQFLEDLLQDWESERRARDAGHAVAPPAPPAAPQRKFVTAEPFVPREVPQYPPPETVALAASFKQRLADGRAAREAERDRALDADIPRDGADGADGDFKV